MAMAAPLSWRDDMDDGKRLRTGPSVGALTGQVHMSRGPVCRCMCVGSPSAGRGAGGGVARGHPKPVRIFFDRASEAGQDPGIRPCLRVLNAGRLLCCHWRLDRISMA